MIGLAPSRFKHCIIGLVAVYDWFSIYSVYLLV